MAAIGLGCFLFLRNKHANGSFGILYSSVSVGDMLAMGVTNILQMYYILNKSIVSVHDTLRKIDRKIAYDTVNVIIGVFLIFKYLYVKS